jgi:response regulator of citrate/malate metabolism
VDQFNGGGSVSSYLLKPFSQEQLAQHLINAKKMSTLQSI